MERPSPLLKIFGVPLTFIGGVGVIATVSNMLSGYQTRLPGPAGLALALVVLAGGVTLLRAKPPAVSSVPQGAEITPTGEVSFDRQILQAMKSCAGRATADRVAALLGISVETATRELGILVAEGACRQLEDGSFYFAEFADSDAKRHAIALAEKK